MIDATRAPSGDPYLAAFREYERTVAPAYEVIRRARARLRDQIVGPLVDDLEVEDSAWAKVADPTEPNGAEIAVDAMLAIPHPEQGLDAGDVPAAPPSAPAPESPSAAASSPPGGGSPAITQPGPSRSGESRRGRRGTAAASSGSVDTTAPAPLTCSCGRDFTTQRGLSHHRTSTGHAEAPVGVAPTPRAATTSTDPREIDELCARGCGRRFRWSPALANHERTCDGRKAA